MDIGLDPGMYTFRESAEQPKLQTVAYMDEWVHQARHESAKHLRLSRSIHFRSIIAVDASRIEIVLECLVDPLGGQLVREEFEVRLVVFRVAEMVSEVVMRDRRRGLSNRTLVTRIIFVRLMEEFPVRPQSIKGKHMVSGMAVGWGLRR